MKMNMPVNITMNIVVKASRLALITVVAVLIVLTLHTLTARSQPRDLTCDLRMDRLICAKTSSRPLSLVELTSTQRDEG